MIRVVNVSSGTVAHVSEQVAATLSPALWRREDVAEAKAEKSAPKPRATRSRRKN